MERFKDYLSLTYEITLKLFLQNHFPKMHLFLTPALIRAPTNIHLEINTARQRTAKDTCLTE